jgi:hypothetical protein
MKNRDKMTKGRVYEIISVDFNLEIKANPIFLRGL